MKISSDVTNLDTADAVQLYLLKDDRIDDVIILEHYEEPAIVVLIEPVGKTKLAFLFNNKYKKRFYITAKTILSTNIPEEITVTLKLIL